MTTGSVEAARMGTRPRPRIRARLPQGAPGAGQAMAGLLQLRWVKPLNGVPT